MGRQTRRGGRRPEVHVRPVQKVELSEKHIGLRIALVILLVAIGATAIAFGVNSLLGADPGWIQVEAATGWASCAEEFTFLYHLGQGEISASAEKKGVTAFYSGTVVEAYRLFTGDQEFEDVHNIAYLNSHPNQEVEVDPGLYRAFSQIQAAGDRSLYLAPVSTRYADLFTCTDDVQTPAYDPYASPEVAVEYAEAASWARDPKAIDLELLGENKVRLRLSPEYQAWAEENGVTAYLDFFWMKNAFIADFLGDRLEEAGYTHGCIASYDGYVRNLDGDGEPYSLPVYDRVGETVYPAGILEYTGPKAMVYLRDYSLSEMDSWRFYRYADGTIRSSYLDPADGKSKSARGDLVCYGKDQSCAQILLEMIPVYVADEFQAERLDALKDRGIFSVYCQDRAILCNDPEAKFTNLCKDGDIVYSARQLP